MKRSTALMGIWTMGITVASALLACGGGSDAVVAANLSCDDSMKSAFKPDANTTVQLVKAFKKGEQMLLSGTATATTPVAANDMCLVKLLVGPGHPGPASAPSTTAGIGIEVWLPGKALWNNRIHLLGGAGMAGGVQSTLTAFAAGAGINPWDVAGSEGAVSATTDTGHVAGNPQFLMKSDGTINTVGWNEFSERGIHEMTLKAKALAQAYYGAAARYTYWHGGSTGGRQGMKQAQAYPADFDGIIATSPAINWSRMTSSILYGQIVTQRDLGGVGMTTAQVNAVSTAALNACDLVNGQHLGFILDTSQCKYDPALDASVLCAPAGTNTTTSCVTPKQATAMNKIWYGQTRDGSVPAPASDTGSGITLAGNQVWYGYPRGSSLATPPFPGLGTITDPAAPYNTLGTDLLALYLQDPTISTPAFINATGNGADGWKNLTYAGLAHASDRALALQSAFSNIDTDNPDLSQFKARGGKLITVYGLSDNLIPYPGIINYYNRVMTQLGGLANVQSFYKLYMVPGMGHFPFNGTVNPTANPPIPTEAAKYALLTDWVEKGIEPGQVTISSVATGTAVAKSQPMCVYPKKASYVSGDINLAASYSCL
ncbi:MAG: tannase/feruloyl esterase family alpha/beta hydrolase [Pseudomonadota bacterium]